MNVLLIHAGLKLIHVSNMGPDLALPFFSQRPVILAVNCYSLAISYNQLTEQKINY